MEQSGQDRTTKKGTATLQHTICLWGRIATAASIPNREGNVATLLVPRFPSRPPDSHPPQAGLMLGSRPQPLSHPPS